MGIYANQKPSKTPMYLYGEDAGGAMGKAPFGAPLGEFVTNASLLRSTAWRNMLAKARGGVDQTVLILDDSTGVGYGGGATGNAQGGVTNQMRWYSWPAQMAKMLDGMGVPANGEGFLGNGNLHGTGATSQYDGRLAIGSGWTFGVASHGGYNWVATASTGNIDYTPLEPVDTFEVYYLQNNSFGSFNWSIDGGSTTPQVCTGANGLGKAIIPAGSVGNHKLSVAWASGSVYICGFAAYKKNRRGLKVLNCGINGGIAADSFLNSNFWDPLKLIASNPPALAILGWGPNYWNFDGVSTTDPAGNTYVTNQTNFISSLTTIANALTAAGSLVMMHTSFPSNPATKASLALQQQYVDAKIALAASLGLPCLDTWRMFGANFATPNGNGWMYDDIHCAGAGYGSTGGMFAKLIASAAY